MKNVLKGSIFYVIIAIIVVLGINYIRGNLVENTGVTYSQFQKYVAQNKVSGVEVRQNSQGVTGELTVHLKDGEYRTLDVSDVTKAEDLLEQKNISYKVTVEKESVFMTTVLPMLLICVIFMVFFTMGSRQATGGNARMMNFGKSRATLTMPDNSKVTFKDVAGLQEEKEELELLPQTDKELLDKIVNFINNHLDNPDLTVDSLVEEAGISRSALFKKIKTLIGISPMELIKNIRLKKAAELVKEGSCNFTQIAYKTGFNDSQYFSKCFKQIYGVTPTEYKRKNLS